MTSKTDHNGTIVIGIDFGTTFTGVAYSYIRADQRGSGNIPPVPITLWPTSRSSQANSDSPKVPSSISYSPGGTTSWGHQTQDKNENREASISWFKLLLLDEKDLQPHLKNSDHVKQARERVQKSGKDALIVISDFLRKVWDHVLEVIIRAWGRQYVCNHPFHVVYTVPAIWQDREIQQMERVLGTAGILNKRLGCADTTHTFISEPEAAALTAIDGFNKLDALKVGQSFIVADLGGGTVDLISFRAKSTEPTLVLEEVVEGEGALCGATFLDQAFLNCIEKKMQRKKWRNRNLKLWAQLHERERKRIMEIDWEKGIKRTYYGEQSSYHIDLGAQGDLRPEIVLDKEDLNNIFDSVYDRISELVDGQVGAILKKTGDMPKFIVLTGGFGRCEYVYRALCQQYEGRIEILFEANDRPWTAVARGAVLSGLAHITNQGQIHSHVSRFSYGWLKWEDFDHHIHDFDDYESHELTGRPMARDQMEWIILRGESVEAQSSRKYAYERVFDIDEVGVLEFSEPLYRSNLACPPKRLAENETKDDSNGLGESPEFREHIVIDMETPVPVERLPKRGGTEFPHRVLLYEVEVNISGSSLVISATSKGKRIGEKVVPGLSE
ncbi:hypothetical protein F5Y03DRAFT_408771 [Xylaria venustula]|nr:hypothetical protein F5Y03DRAFT_408771 [Xylaria venustula]